ncbi:MAG: hypothetical protein IPN76_31280 [Saprospiraceae bacterium]|nr:hypothetical protein [Saprospiraceae bacterium]
MKITKFFIWIAAILFCSSIQTQAQTFDGPLRVHLRGTEGEYEVECGSSPR